MNKPTNTSWQKVSPWYQQSVGIEGNYFHQQVIIPGVIRLLNLNHQSSLLDLGCGQGILERAIPKEVNYQGIDLAPSLIDFAIKNRKNLNHKFSVGDVAEPLAINNSNFSQATIILALQNIEFPNKVILNCQKHLMINGKLVIVLNHPCFRIPRQTSWEIDENNKIQFRRINRYLTPLKIPIKTTYDRPEKNSITWSFHQPISYYSQILSDQGFSILKIEEWISDKESVGKAAKMENRARSEFPLFLAILAQKISNKVTEVYPGKNGRI